MAKEYVAAQGLGNDDSGVLLLSEFAGASVELKYALLTNPYDMKSLKEGLLHNEFGAVKYSKFSKRSTGSNDSDD